MSTGTSSTMTGQLAILAPAGRSESASYRLPAWYNEQHARENATRYLPRTEVEATIRRYLEVKQTSKLLGSKACVVTAPPRPSPICSWGQEERAARCCCPAS